jgi:hypothetical protein
MAIEQLLQALNDGELGGDAASDRVRLLRARLVADFSEALSKDAPAPDGHDEISLNEVAAHLAGLSLVEEREKWVAALAGFPQSRAAFESAAAFLADVKHETKPVSAAVLNEAMLAFAPAGGIAAAAIMPQPIADKRFNWQAWGAMAAVLLVGVIGGAHLRDLGYLSGHAPSDVSMPPTSTPKTSVQTLSPQPPTAAVRAAPRVLDPQAVECDAASALASSAPKAKDAAVSAGGERASGPVAAAGQTPCGSSSPARTESSTPSDGPQTVPKPAQERAPRPEVPTGSPY